MYQDETEKELEENEKELCSDCNEQEVFSQKFG